MQVFVFGNPDLLMDSLPLRILPELRKRFPTIEFLTPDPNEEWDLPAVSEVESVSDNITIIDTALGIKDVTVFDSLEKFSPAPRITMHDFDALANLRLLVKLGKIKNIKIIGIPPTISETSALEAIDSLLLSPQS